MKARRTSTHGHPALLVIGLASTVFGVAILIALGTMLYDGRFSEGLVVLGIPATLLAEFVGVAAAFTGGAIIVAWASRRRRARRTL